jgi:hypothetical protein
MPNSIIYGIASLYSLVVYFFFVMPPDFIHPFSHSILAKIGILLIILIFPLIFARLFITKGYQFLLFSSPFYVVSLFFLYRAFNIENQKSLLEYSFIKSGGSAVGIENILLYILFSLLGIIIALIFYNQPK